MFGQFAKNNLGSAGTDPTLAIAPESLLARSELQDTLPLNSPSSSSNPPPPPNNIAPENLRFGLNRSKYSLSDTLQVTSGWVYDGDGGDDLASVNFELIENGNSLGMVGNGTNFTTATWNDRWASFNFQLDLNSLSLTGGTYQVIGQARDNLGATSNLFQRSFLIESPQTNNAPKSLQFNLSQGTYQATDTLQIKSGWVNDKDGASELTNVVFSLWKNGSEIDSQSLNTLSPATWDDRWANFSYDYDIANLGLDAGDYTLRGIAYDQWQANSNTFEKAFKIASSTPINQQPKSLQFRLDKSNYSVSDSVILKQGWVMDEDGASDLDKISLSLWKDGNKVRDIGEITNLTPATWSDRWASFTETYTLNSWGIGSGDYTLQATAYDLGGLASDQFERTFSIDPVAIDLKANSFDITSNSTNSGTSVTANFQLQNTGNSDVGAFRVGFYLSTDETITVNDKLLNFLDISTLGAQELTSTLSQVLNLPESDDPFWQGNGNYYIGIIVDDLNAIAEGDENNNARFDVVDININQPSRDLRGESFSLNASTFNAGDSFDYTWEIKNVGTERLENIKIGFYISSDSTITTDDRLFRWSSLSGLSAGQSWGTTSLGAKLPDKFSSDAWIHGSGTYYIGMIVDYENTIGEDIESNNSSRGIGIDLAEIQVDNTGIFNTTGNNDIDSLLNEGRRYWEGGAGSSSPNTITYSFYQNSSGAYYGGEENVSEVDADIKNNVREILSNISKFVNLDFQEVADNSNSYGVMRFMFSTSADYAYAYLPGSSEVEGDVFLNPNVDRNTSNWFGKGFGSHGYNSLIHEIGHALGLKHPGNYNGSAPSPFLDGAQDNNANTVMSYNFTGAKPITAMSYDIRNLQYLYGAKDFNNGNTTYTFNEVDNYSIGGQSFGSTTDKIKQTVWDSGGLDIFDASNLSLNQTYRFDLREGGLITTQSSYDSINYSDVGGRGNFSTSDEGTAIAFGTAIENLITSRSNDYVIANTANNLFSGYNKGNNWGDDIFELTDSADLLDLSSYGLADLSENMMGNDLKLNLGTDGSITFKNYFSTNDSIRTKIGTQSYIYNQVSGWQIA
ncbi:CARDB domain-containing protein [Spirulina sp. 06S082]|uniref:CARDB domain-containing protein n=1 Tax=Spirulina sp. 06S082 TaxID=3110248 RepID=UPI002B20441A|nr:CARDB domain-containing protein [Spirulina sp. 06S082]MEA5469721.1 CARDB domain-containing protein [Spirulina sp. 06S082]